MITYSDRNITFNFSQLYYTMQDVMPEDFWNTMSLSETEYYVKDKVFNLLRDKGCDVEVFAIVDHDNNLWGGSTYLEANSNDDDEYIRITLVSGESLMYLKMIYANDITMLYAEVCDLAMAKEGIVV